MDKVGCTDIFRNMHIHAHKHNITTTKKSPWIWSCVRGSTREERRKGLKITLLFLETCLFLGKEAWGHEMARSHSTWTSVGSKKRLQCKDIVSLTQNSRIRPVIPSNRVNIYIHKANIRGCCYRQKRVWKRQIETSEQTDHFDLSFWRQGPGDKIKQ